jgi:ribonuclease Z
MKKGENIMTSSKKPELTSLTRRDALRLAGLAVGGLAFGGAMFGPRVGNAHGDDACDPDGCTCPEGPTCTWTDAAKAQRYNYFDQLDEFYPFRPKVNPEDSTIPLLGEQEMRITFMGSCIPNNLRKKQMMMSVFVEVGWDEKKQMPLDNFIFDCGSGVCTNYNAMNVNFGRMDKIFLNHLHGDHMSDLTHIYCFGVTTDRLSPLYVWGPKASGVKSPASPKRLYDDGVKAYCEHLRAACRWHTESFSFQSTSYTPDKPDNRPLVEKWGLPYEPRPVGDDDPNDGYAMVPIELDWEKGGIAYWNRDTGVKITYFKVIHARKGSIGYKLEWTPPVPGAKTLSMIYTSDTKPETLCIEQAKNGGKGVDVFIHEMIVPAEVWAMKSLHLTDPDLVPPSAVQQLQRVQNSSHTPQGAFGYLLSQIDPRPRLTVATHFPAADDTVACAMKSVMEHCNVVQGRDPTPEEHAARITWSFDCMVITVSKDQILEQRGVVSDFEWSATVQQVPGAKNPPKYRTEDGQGDPYAQIDQTTAIQPCDCETGACNYRADGY